ncbi:uncharacterized protein LOC108743390 [Agrilus planipennis]|uniref:Uncharacterized protein LOC108743390 n=1 Tax=Agrilus planipennis TaxID=224129 RepID=A0A1W4XNW0_AGRPL|nr:uncharacterized protein LOC108743390 [Agrilus planipennis]
MKETCERRYRLQKNPLDNDDLVMNKGSGTLGRRGLKITGGGVRRQRSLEWRRDRGYSSSEEEFPSRPSVDSHVFASLLAQAQKEYSSVERSYRSDDTEDATTTDNPTTPFPTPPATLASPLRSPLPHHRQASPFPLENTNSRRIHYATPQDRLRGTNGEVAYSSSSTKKSNISGSGSNNSRNHRSHHGRKCGMTSSSSATSCNSCADSGREAPYEQQQQQRHCVDNDVNEESPPEPAPPEIPPRGPSLHSTTLRRRGEYSLPLGETQKTDHPESQFLSQGEYVLSSGSPRTAGYPARSPMSSNVNSQHR